MPALWGWLHAKSIVARHDQSAREERTRTSRFIPGCTRKMADIDAELSVSLEKVCFVIAKAREFETKKAPDIPDEASNPSDDRMIEVLEDRPSEDVVLQELRSIIGGMSEDEQTDLVALAWLGRGDAGAEGWEELRGEAARSHNRRTAAYLLGMAAATHLPSGRSRGAWPLVRRV